MKGRNLFALHVSRFTFAVYFVLAAAYGVINPLFEAPDEQHHYFTAESIALYRRLPVVEAEADPWLRQEAAQPPLYYLLAAALIAPLPLDPAVPRAQLHFNPYVRLGDPTSSHNLNAFVHGPAESWPWRSWVLAAHLLRLFSSVLGLGTLWLIGDSARRLWPDQPARVRLAVTLVAFLPQFIFIHSAISNDPLIIFLCTAALWQLLCLWQKTAGMRGLGDYVLLGITIGLAALTKNQGLLLAFLAAGAVMAAAVRQRVWRQSLLALFCLGGTIILLAGWWWWRNWLLYGDYTATSQFIRLAGGDQHYTLRHVLAESELLWLSLIGRFGWMNVAPPIWVYWLWNGLVLVAAVGGGWQVASGRRRSPSKIQNPKSKIVPAGLWLALWVALVYGGLILFMLKTPAAQGRLLFPALLPLALATAFGLTAFRADWLNGTAAGVALFTALYVGAVTLPRAYARPKLLPEAALPETATLLRVDVGQGLELVAAQMETTTAVPGDDVWLTLYWRAHRLPSRPPILEASLVGRELEGVGSVVGYHGRGHYPATLWPLETIVADRFSIHLREGMNVPVEARLYVHLLDGGGSWPAATLKVVPPTWPSPADEVLASFEGGIQLAAAQIDPPVARPGHLVTVHLTWQVTAAVGRDLTTFVHLLGTDANLITQGDRPPLNGYYPSHWWAAGEQFPDSYELDIPAGTPDGRYSIWLGLYDPLTLVRQPLYLDGRRQPNDAYRAGELVVKREE